MRIRQVKPAFWQDAKIAALPHDARLFYIGLWSLADDEGWLRWDVAEIGVELYGFENRKSREKRIARMAGEIQKLPGDQKLVLYLCGHAQLPKLAVHQHLAGTTKRVTTVHAEHGRCVLPANPRDDPRLPADAREDPPRIGNGWERVGVGEGNVSVLEKGGVARAQGATDLKIKEPRRSRITPDDVAAGMALLPSKEANDARPH